MGHSRWFAVKAGKNNSASGLDCFADLKVTPSGRYLLNLRSSRDRSAEMNGLVNATLRE